MVTVVPLKDSIRAMTASLKLPPKLPEERVLLWLDAAKDLLLANALVGSPEATMLIADTDVLFRIARIASDTKLAVTIADSTLKIHVPPTENAWLPPLSEIQAWKQKAQLPDNEGLYWKWVMAVMNVLRASVACGIAGCQFCMPEVNGTQKVLPFFNEDPKTVTAYCVGNICIVALVVD